MSHSVAVSTVLRFGTLGFGWLLASAPAAAQRTWLVDQYGHGDFADIPPAVAAAAPGDTIVVGGVGPYSLDVTIDKALALSAVPTRFARGHLRIANLARGRVVTVTGFAPFPADRLSVEIAGCHGFVVLSDVICDGRATMSSEARPALTVIGSQAVFVKDVQATGAPGALLRASTVAGYTAGFRGTPRSSRGGGSLQGLDAEGCWLHLVADCWGGTGAQSALEGGHGIWLRSCSAWLTGSSTAGTAVAPLVANALLAECSLVRANATPGAGMEFAGPVDLRWTAMRTRAWPVLGVGAFGGGSPGFGFTALGTPGDLVAIVASAPAPPRPTAWGPLWLQESPILVIAVAALGPTGELRANLQLPPALPRGLTFASQAVELRAGTGLVLSNPFFPVTWW